MQTPLLFDEAIIGIIWGVIIVLFLLFIIITLYALIKRRLLAYWQKRLDIAENTILPKIYEYIDGEITEEQFDRFLKNRFDIITAFGNINEMIDNLKGDEKNRLRELLDLPRFKKFYLKKLNSSRTVQIAKACMYFEKKNITDAAVIRKLQKLQHHSYNVIGYSATLALLNTDNQRLRENALKTFLLRSNNSSLTVSDIIYKFYSECDTKQEAAEAIFEQITDDQIPGKHIAPIITMLPELGLYGLATPLYELFRKPIENDDSDLILAAFIRGFNHFSTIDIFPVLKEKETWSSPFDYVRLETANWMKDRYRPEFDDILIRLANDPDKEVRIVSQAALLQSDQAKNALSFLEEKYAEEWKGIKESGGRIAEYH
ncbi:MAG: hypothetical protein R3283_02875 [Balneolaceae bacterium]|nr:hypothetical protein [Balneolaceae bacterium]